MGLLSLRSASVEIRTRSLVRLVRRASHASSTSTISPISQSREVGSRSIVPRCRKRPCLREINQHLPLFLCFGSKCPIQSLLGVFAELFGLGHCQNSYVGSVPPVLRSLGSMTEASLCKIAHPGLQCKIINRLSLLPSSKEPTIGRVTAPTPPTLKRLKRDRLTHPTAPLPGGAAGD